MFDFLCISLYIAFKENPALVYIAHDHGFCCFRPTLPPAKQANRNLILKAISEAQDSITKTTAYPTSMFQGAIMNISTVATTLSH